MSRTLIRAVAAVAAAAVVATGCSDDKQPEQPTVDLAALNTGNYPTTPRTFEAEGTDAQGVAREARRIANHVILALDVDPKLTNSVVTNQHIVRPAANGKTRIADEEFPGNAPGFVVGWISSGQRRISAENGKRVDLYVLRFTDDQNAAKTAENMAASDLRAHSYYKPFELSKPDGAHAHWGEDPGTHKAEGAAWLAVGSYVIGVSVADPFLIPAAAQPLGDLLSAVLEQQKTQLESLEPTPVDKMKSLPADRDGLLGRTLVVDPTKKEDPEAGVYDLAGMLHFSKTPARLESLFADAGVDIVALNDAIVARAKDSASANDLQTKWVERYADERAPIDAPPGLPNAKCDVTKEVSAEGSSSSSSGGDKKTYTCTIAYDRYVASIAAAQEEDLYQRTAAQYKLLAANE